MGVDSQFFTSTVSQYNLSTPNKSNQPICSSHLPAMSGPGTSPRGRLTTTITIDDATPNRSPSPKTHAPPSPGTSTMSGEIDPIPVDVEPDWPSGWRPWFALAGCFFLMFNSWGLVNAYGTFATYYKESLMTDQTLYMFNLIGSTESFVVLL